MFLWLLTPHECQYLRDTVEKAMARHSSTFAWKIPWTEEPGRLQSMGSLESDTTEWLPFHFSISCIGEGNGNPLQCSCLENPRDGKPGGLPSLGSHRVGQDWSDLAAAVAWQYLSLNYRIIILFIDSSFLSLPDLFPHDLYPHFIWMRIWKEMVDKVRLHGSNLGATTC